MKVLLLALAATSVTFPVPVIPATDDSLVFILPDVGGPRAKLALEEMRRRHAADPRDAEAAATLAGALAADGRDLADPRLLGRAEAILQPWWADDSAPLPILRLRAQLRNSPGDFEAILAAAPGDPDALLALGRDTDCQALSTAGDAVRAALCTATLATARNDHATVLATLAPHVDPMVTFEPALKSRALSLAATASVATGDLARAEQYLQHATFYLPHDRTKANDYREFLRSQGRSAEAPPELPAAAPASTAMIEVKTSPAGVTAALALDLRDVAAVLTLDDDKDGGVTWGELKSHKAALERYVARRLHVHEGPRTCGLGEAALGLADQRAVLAYALSCPTSSPQNLAFTYDLFFDLDTRHRAEFSGTGQTFTSDKRDHVLVLREPSTAESFVGVAQLGLALAVLFLTWIFFMRERRSPPRAAGSAMADAPPPTSPSPQPR